MGVANRRKKEEEAKGNSHFWDKSLGWVTAGWLTYLMLVYVLYCPEGFVNYDIHKRTILYVGGLIYIIVAIAVKALSAGELSWGEFKASFRLEKYDILYVLMLISWIIAFIGADDRYSAFWGDVYRYIGLSMMLLYVGTAWIVSKTLRWNDYLTKVLFLLCFIEYMFEICQYFRFDPLNFQLDFTVSLLWGTLGAQNQNGVFVALAYSILSLIYLRAADKTNRILSGILVCMSWIAGICITSSDFQLGAAAGMLILLGYSFTHAKYLKRMANIAIFTYLGIFLSWAMHQIILGGSYELMSESITLFMYKPVMLVLMAAAVALFAVVCGLGHSFFEKYEKTIGRLYIILVVVLILGFVALMIYLNVFSGLDGSEDTLLAALVIDDDFGTGRGFLWSSTLDVWTKGSTFDKIFGIGFNNFSSRYLIYYPDAWGGSVLADGHNGFIDLLMTTGIVGVIIYWGIIFSITVRSFKAMKRTELAIYGIMGTLVYATECLINSNLNVTTALGWALFAFALNVLYQAPEEKAAAEGMPVSEAETVLDSAATEEKEAEEKPAKSGKKRRKSTKKR